MLIIDIYLWNYSIPWILLYSASILSTFIYIERAGVNHWAQTVREVCGGTRTPGEITYFYWKAKECKAKGWVVREQEFMLVVGSFFIESIRAVGLLLGTQLTLRLHTRWKCGLTFGNGEFFFSYPSNDGPPTLWPLCQWLNLFREGHDMRVVNNCI